MKNCLKIMAEHHVYNCLKDFNKTQKFMEPEIAQRKQVPEKDCGVLLQ